MHIHQSKRIFISIVVPCLNESETITELVKDVKSNLRKYLSKYKSEIIIADNGSLDGTLQLLKKISGIRVVKVPVLGYGAALHFGINSAFGKYIIFADADMSYPFSNLKKFAKVLDYQYDLILGSRIKGSIQVGAMPFLHRYLGTPVLTLLIRVLYNIKTTDCNSGMRMIKKSFYRKLNIRNSGMEWASELILKTALAKGKYFEVPIVYRKDKRGKKAHLSTWADGWRHLKAILLIQPKTILFGAICTFVFSLTTYRNSFEITFLLLIMTYVLFLSYLTLKLLESIIEQQKNKISEFLLQFKIVPIVFLLTVVCVVVMYFVSDQHMGTKLIISSTLGITYMWVFLVETIKTHLANRLPDL